MRAVVFSHSSATITFATNPAWPTQSTRSPVQYVVRAYDGTPRVYDKGDLGVETLTWTTGVPMTAADHASLQTLVAATLGGVDPWTYTDPEGESHVARFASVEQFTEVESGGYVGTVVLHLTDV